MRNGNFFSLTMLGCLLVVNLLVISESISQRPILAAYLFTTFASILYAYFFIRFLSTSFFFLTFFLMLFFVEPVLYYLMGEQFQRSIFAVKSYGLLTLCGLPLFLLGHALISRKDSLDFVDVAYSEERVKRVVVFMAIFSAALIPLLYIDAGTTNIVSLGRYELKSEGAGLRVIANFGLYVASLLFFFVFIQAKKKSAGELLVWILLFVVFEILVFLFYRTRTYLIAHTSAILVGYYYSSFVSFGSGVLRITQDLRVKTNKGVIGAIGLVLFALAITLRFFRGYLQPGQSAQDFDFNFSDFVRRSIEAGDLGYSVVVFDLLDLVPEQYGYIEGQSYYRLLFLLVPRFLWPDKPINTESIVGQWMRPELIGISIPPGISGDLFLNFGLFGVVFMLLYGVVFSLIDRALSVRSFVLWAVSSTWIFHLVRGSFTNPVVIFLVLYFSVLLIDRYARENYH